MRVIFFFYTIRVRCRTYTDHYIYFFFYIFSGSNSDGRSERLFIFYCSPVNYFVPFCSSARGALSVRPGGRGEPDNWRETAGGNAGRLRHTRRRGRWLKMEKNLITNIRQPARARAPVCRPQLDNHSSLLYIIRIICVHNIIIVITTTVVGKYALRECVVTTVACRTNFCRGAKICIMSLHNSPRRYVTPRLNAHF